MALADILTAIEQNTADTLSQMRKNHQQRMLEMKRETEARLEEFGEAISKQKEQKLRQMRAKANSHGLLRGKHAIVRKKQELIGDAYEAFLGELKEMKGEEVRMFLERAVSSLGNIAGTIHPAPAHTALLTSLVAGKPYLSIGKPIDAVGGFRFAGENREHDFTFESLVSNSLRPRTELDIARLLFS